MNDILSGLKAKLIKYALWAALSGGVTFMGLVYGIYHAGQKNIQDKWDLEKAEVAAKIKELEEKANSATAKIEIQYVDRDRIIYEKGETITKYVNKYITVSEDAKCVIPKNVILLHDAAAKNIVPAGGETQ